MALTPNSVRICFGPWEFCGIARPTLQSLGLVADKSNITAANCQFSRWHFWFAVASFSIQFIASASTTSVDNRVSLSLSFSFTILIPNEHHSNIAILLNLIQFLHRLILCLPFLSIFYLCLCGRSNWYSLYDPNYWNRNNCLRWIVLFVQITNKSILNISNLFGFVSIVFVLFWFQI